MRGHLQQRSRDTWRLKVYVGRSADGRKRYVERTVHGSRREAGRELARLVVEVDEGRHVASAPMTVGELLDRWLDLKAMTVEVNTANGYRWIAERYVRPAFGDRKVASIRTLELDHLYQQLRAGGGSWGRPLSGRTVRLCHTVMRQSLEQARKWGLIARNPAVDATPPASKRTFAHDARGLSRSSSRSSLTGSRAGTIDGLRPDQRPTRALRRSPLPTR